MAESVVPKKRCRLQDNSLSSDIIPMFATPPEALYERPWTGTMLFSTDCSTLLYSKTLGLRLVQATQVLAFKKSLVYA